MLAGAKDKLCARIAKKEQNMTTIEQRALVINQYLQPTKRTQGDDKPASNQFYADHFNLVDRFNRFVSMIRYKPRCSSEQMRIFISLIEIAIVQTWCLYHDFQSQSAPDESDIREFAISLAKSLA